VAAFKSIQGLVRIGDEGMSGWWCTERKRWSPNAADHPFIYDVVDLGPQPWIGCASNHGADFVDL
jgi:hypothetical protein